MIIMSMNISDSLYRGKKQISFDKIESLNSILDANASSQNPDMINRLWERSLK